jgi:general secretion pathway protein G
MMTLQRQKGFSLIEIMVVIVIMGLLLSYVAPKVFQNVEKAQQQKIQADFSSIKTALANYRLDNYVYPTSEQGLEALVTKPQVAPEPRGWRSEGYLDKVPQDPWQREYLYLSPGENGRPYEIYTLGADGVRGGTGQDADVSNWDDPNQQQQQQ